MPLFTCIPLRSECLSQSICLSHRPKPFRHSSSIRFIAVIGFQRSVIWSVKLSRAAKKKKNGINRTWWQKKNREKAANLWWASCDIAAPIQEGLATLTQRTAQCNAQQKAMESNVVYVLSQFFLSSTRNTSIFFCVASRYVHYLCLLMMCVHATLCE